MAIKRHDATTIANDEEGQRAEDVVDALERAAMGYGDAISTCKEGHKTSTGEERQLQISGE